MKQGYMDTPIGMIPEDWELVKLGDVAELIMSNVDKKNHSNENEVLLCNYLDVYENEYITNGLKFMSATASDAEIERFLLKKGDVIVTKDSETKEDIAHSSAVIQDFENTLCGYHLALIRPINRNFDNIFLSKLFSINSVHKELVNKANGTTRYGLTVGTFEKLLLPFPPLPEQTKIASILSIVDDKIDSISERINQTQQLKNSLMQRLLTKGIGHTKFKDSPLGEIPVSWEVVKLDDYLEKIVGGGTPSRTIESYWNGKIPWATVKDLKKSILDDTEECITEIGLKNSASNLIPRKTIIIATRMALGKVVFFTKDVAINQDLKAIFTKPLLIENFLFHWFALNAKKIEELGSGSTVKGIRLEVLRALDLALPPISEQREISKILTDFDGKLDILQEKKTQNSKLKQGLMQQLLTGNIRVMV